MNPQVLLLLEHPVVIAALRDAWLESNPGITGGHEEGGFILIGASNQHLSVRWPIGSQREIVPLPHWNCRINGNDIVASFHTHPNIGPNFLQEPSERDKRTIRTDQELKGINYLGEIVISNALIYLVDPTGLVQVVGKTSVILQMHYPGDLSC